MGKIESFNSFVKFIKESSEFEDIEDTLLEIYDIFGEPHKQEYKVGQKMAYTLSWNIGFDISEFNGIKELEKILKVFEMIKSIRSSQSRISDYDFDFSLTDSLRIRLTPKNEVPSQSYKFFHKQDGRQVLFSYGEIAKFLKDRGFSIKKVEVEEYNSGDNCQTTIYTDATREVCIELMNSINRELNSLSQEELDRGIIVSAGNGYITINPEEEKCYVELTKN